MQIGLVKVTKHITFSCVCGWRDTVAISRQWRGRIRDVHAYIREHDEYCAADTHAPAMPREYL